MLGIIYLVLCMLIGKELAGLLLSKKSGYDQIWLTLAAAFGTGVLIMGWATYMTAWAASEAGAVHPLIYANAVVMPVAALIVLILYWKRYRKAGSFKGTFVTGMITERRLFRKEAVFFGALLVFLTWIMFYVFFIKDGVLYSGYTVYGDYAPHTAMMRSFSMGNNFPTEYPHFGGQDVKYHFMFQFFVGNLEFLGLRLDFAYNVVSVLALLGFLIFLYHMAKRLTGSFAAGVLTVFFFFFRSSLSFFRFVIEHLSAGDLWTTLRDNTTFIGYTTNENWGLWNFNVYLNQRHLAFGLLIVTLVLWVFMDWLEAGCSAPERGVRWIKNRIFTKKAWLCVHSETALLAGMLLGLTSFWNGAAVIGGLLILMGFAVFSDGKLDYLILAVTSVIFSVLQTKIFIWGNAVSPSFYWGFLSENKSITGVLWYLIQMSGVFFVGAVLIAFFLRERRQRAALVSFLFPLIGFLSIA